MSAEPATLLVESRFTGSDPHGLVPSQWEDRLRPATSAELRLMAAVMIDAIRDFRQAGDTRGPRARQLARLATRWILSRNMSWPYSFESICAVFDIDARDLRATLVRERAMGSQQRRPRRRRNLVMSGANGPGMMSRRARNSAAIAAERIPASEVA